MFDFASKLFDTTDFPARWNCGRWTTGHGWLHVLSDLGIWGAYFAIPLILIFFTGKRPDVPFRAIFLLFGSFILACGTTHLLEAVIFWWPIYRFAGLVKLATAVISWATIGALIRILPSALALRSPAMLEAEVAKRTSELKEANLALHKEMAERERISEELRRLTADLSEANRRKSEFLAILAHELRNPLAPLQNGAEILRQANCDEDTVREIAATFDRQTGQMARLIDDLMDVSRITRGKLQLHLQTTRLEDVIDCAIESTRPLIEAEGQSLIVDLIPDDICLPADRTRLAQVFSNLLNNAVKYNKSCGRIWIKIEPGTDQVTVSVRDEGIGIPEGKQEQVFEMFSQLDQPAGKPRAGLGIGLTLVRQLVGMHGGEVGVLQNSPDPGSTFVVRLPTVADDGSPRPEVHRSERAQIRRRVLVVDDNADAALTLRLVLQKWGHEVRVAHDGQQAVIAAQDFRPDVIFMDIGMPVLDGYEAAREIRRHPWGQKMLIVALSGWGQAADKERAAEAGFDQHLVKPGRLDEIAMLLSKLPS